MTTLFYKNPRLAFLVVSVTTLAGFAGLMLLPRMEDPPLTPRAAKLVTSYPGAEAERVAALITAPIENALDEIEEIKEVQSESRAGVSFLAIELVDSVTDTEAKTIWGRVRDKASDAALQFPADAGKPELDRIEIRAFALLVGLTWDSSSPVNYGLLGRLSEQIRDRIDAVDGTERTELVCDPPEEVLVTIAPEVAASMGLSAGDIADSIAQHDAKVSAGAMRSEGSEVLLAVSGTLRNLTSIGQVPVQSSTDGGVVQLSDISTVEKTVASPLPSKALIGEKPAVIVAAMVRDSVRLDQWSESANRVLAEFRDELPVAVGLEIVLDQNRFVDQRLGALSKSLLLSAIAVVLVATIFQGFSASLIVAVAIPLTMLSVLAAMHWIGIPLHQMSVAGLIISLGLMIDASLISVDEVLRRVASGQSRINAVGGATRFLSVPLSIAALTTIVSFSPIALMPGPSGEFVGAIGSVVILAISFSVFWSLTLVVALAGWFPGTSRGLSAGPLQSLSRGTLALFYGHPLLGVAGCIALSVFGLFTVSGLQSQFFPAADRNQFYVDFYLPDTSSLAETERVSQLFHEAAMADTRVKSISWFLGESAPEFYYNVVPDRQSTPSYGQGIIECEAGTRTPDVIEGLQARFSEIAPETSVAVRQLEQGPPFSAPIEIRLSGPSPELLDRLSEQVRLVLIETPSVVLTRDESSDAIPKVIFEIDEDQARLVNLSQVSIARNLRQSLEGVTGGTILEGDEELPVRVRVSHGIRDDLNRIASLEFFGLDTTSGETSETYPAVPLSAIARTRLSDEDSTISRFNGQPVNEVMAYLTAGALPTEVLKVFQNRLTQSGFQLPPGYSLSVGGAEARRDEAIDNLLANVLVWAACFIAVLVLSFQSFRYAAIVLAVGGLAIGYGMGSLWLFNLPWGFMAIVGTIGMLGAVVNDSIIVLSVLRSLPSSRAGSRTAALDAVMENSRHIWSTTATTVVGFIPLVVDGGSFWTPVAVTIAGGVLWGTLLSIVFVPCAYLIVSRGSASHQDEIPDLTDEDLSRPQLSAPAADLVHI